ncbi:MAG: hypothetical protein U9R54_05420, partial [Bacteroidota bacterium]|nr:hypothetical protein [Bacteroidota bacterium]
STLEMNDSINKYWKTFSPKFIGTIDLGKETSMPCWPENTSSGFDFGGASVNGYGFGVGIDYRPFRKLVFFFDITAHSWMFQVAEKGSRSESLWVFEQTDYSTRYTGVFDRDVYFYMNTTLARIGARYIFPISKKIEPWIGLGYGFGVWTGNFLSSDKKSTYGNDSNNNFSLSYLAGIDFYVSPLMNKISVFIDVGSPVAKPIEIDNLFYEGWTWESSTGEHAILPYRIGLALGF